MIDSIGRLNNLVKFGNGLLKKSAEDPTSLSALIYIGEHQ